MRATIQSLMCMAVVLSALCVRGSVARADETTDWMNSLREEQKYNDYIDWSMQRTRQMWNEIDNIQASKESRAEQSKPASTVTLQKQATALIQQKQYAQAIRLCDQAIALNPKNALAYNERGAAYSWTDQYDKAIESYTQAIQLDPSLAVAWRNRGSMYFHKGEYDKAVADCTEAIRLDGSYASAYLTRDLASNHLKRDAEAKSEVKAADKSALNKEAPAGNERAAAFSWNDNTIENCAMAILLVPALAVAWRNRGSMHFAKGEQDNAIAECRVPCPRLCVGMGGR